MLEWKRIAKDSGERRDALGPNPFGYIAYSPDGRVMVFVLKSVGTYEVEDNRVVHFLDGSWNELWTGTTQVRFISFEGDHLVYTTPETTDPLDGVVCTYRVVFERCQASVTD